MYLFLDESRFNLSHSDGRARVYHRQNERYADCCVQERDRFGGGNVMVWAGITSRRRTNLVFVDGTLTAGRYRDNILAVEVVNFLNHNGPGITFSRIMQDRTRKNYSGFSSATEHRCIALAFKITRPQSYRTHLRNTASDYQFSIIKII